MRTRLLMTGLAMGVTMAALMPLPALAQNRALVPRMPDGKPSLEGTFNFATITPLERPAALKGKETLSQEEAAAFEASENRRLNRDLFDPEKGAPTAGYPPRSQGGVLSYNEFWYERGNQLTKDKRTSLIVDPPDGRLPMTEAARQKAAEERKKMYEGFADSHTDRTLADRCLVGFNAGPPMVPGAYNNNLQIVQTGKDLLIFTEMVHTARVIPIDGRPHGTMRRWSGDSRGRWEGDTLVVETKNFLRETSLQGSSADTQLVERFTRIDDKTIKYEFTVTDPHSYTRPWTAVVPLVSTSDPIFEYACHEGNYGMEGILKGARLRDREAGTK